MMKKYTKDSINKMLFKEYDSKYNVIEYIDTKTKMVLNCSIHGHFNYRLDHLRKRLLTHSEPCQCCDKEIKRLNNFKKFVERARKVHGDKYDYSKVEYLDSKTPVCIICPEHGEFWQAPANHATMGQGCDKCYQESKKGRYKHSKKEIIEMCIETHGNKYNYDNIIYQGMKEKILNIFCHKHGFFNQVAYDHIRGFGCEKCKFEKQTMTKDEFIAKAKIVHNNFYKYEYDKINYVNNHIKIPIICPEHGEFKQLPGNHLLGVGCNKCNMSKLEKEIEIFLELNNIKFIHYHNFRWLKRLELDFYLPNFNIAIECQGIQHFKPIELFGGEKDFLATQERDSRKRKLCEEHGVKLLYYSNLTIDYPYQVFTDKNELLKEIKGE